jgi:hypothetical protein
MATAGYSGTPLPQKLGIAPGMTLHVIDAPVDYAALIAPVGAEVAFATRITGDVDVLHAFVTRRRRLREVLDRCRARLGPDAVVWVSWPKKTSGIASEITEDAIREAALPLGFVDVKVCAVDATWSGLKLVVRKTLR